jgi:hypothetical protein
VAQLFKLRNEAGTEGVNSKQNPVLSYLKLGNIGNLLEHGFRLHFDIPKRDSGFQIVERFVLRVQ